MPVLIDAEPEYTVTFTPHDTLSTDTAELAYQIRTLAGGVGTLLDSGTCTNNVVKVSNTIEDLELAEGTNTRYVRIRDGANNWSDTAFSVDAESTPLTPTEVDEALTSGVVAIFFSFEQRNADFSFVADITTAVRGASIDCVNNRAVVRTAQFAIDRLTLPVSFDVRTSLIAVNGTLQTGRTEQLFTLGLFRLDTSEEEFEPGSEIWPSVPGSDLSSVLASAKYDEPFTIGGTENVIETVREIIETESINGYTLRHNLADDASVFPVRSVWDPQISKLSIINDMLHSIHWYSLWADEKGVLISRPLVEPAVEEVAVIYTTVNEPRMIGYPFRRRRTPQGLPNAVKVLIDDPRRTFEYAHVTNDDPLSSISTLNAPTNPIDVDGSLVTDITLARTIARFYLLEAEARGNMADLITDFDPRRKPHETFKLYIYDDLRQMSIEDGSLYRSLSWRITLKTGAPMQHSVGKVQPLTLTTVV